VGRGIGIFLGLLAAIAIAAGGFLSARERSEAVPGAGGGLSAGAAGGPLGGGGEPAAGGYGQQPAAGQPVGGQPAGGAPAAGAAAPGAGAASAGAADPGAGAAAGGNPAPDWYEDPRGEARLRYWDGQQWTDQTAD
jgi:hypothetical protein